MSYLDQPSSANDGTEAFSDPERWNDFVQAVLDVTVQGYQDLYAKRLVNSQSEEDFFTNRLRDCIRPLAFKQGIRLQSQFLLDTPEIIAGQITEQNAKKLDLYLYSTWEENYDKIYFTWECKLIALSDKPEHKHLIYKYIVNGIVRFLHEEWKYAGYVSDSGMLGYVLAGNVDNIVEAINREMLIPSRPRRGKENTSLSKGPSLSSYPFSAVDHLKPASSLATFQHIYQSHHCRSFNNDMINLYHLFFVFDFSTIE